MTTWYDDLTAQNWQDAADDARIEARRISGAECLCGYHQHDENAFTCLDCPCPFLLGPYAITYSRMGTQWLTEWAGGFERRCG